MSIRFKGKNLFLYSVLFLSIYNDILRIPGTDVSLFRIVQPLAFVYTIFSSKRNRKVYAVYFCVMLFNCLQYYLFASNNIIGISASASEFASFAYFYFCISSVICAVISLFESVGESFHDSFIRFLKWIGWCNIIIILLHGFLRGHTQIVLANINNYGASIACTFPFYFVSSLKKRRGMDICACVLSVLGLYLGDCKLSLIGVFLQTILALYFLSKSNKHGQNDGLYIQPMYLGLILVGVVILTGFFIYDDLGAFVFQQMRIAGQKIHSLEYLTTASSLGYRINIIIFGFRWLINTKLLGIGMGNFGKLIRVEMPYLLSRWLDSGYVSPHNPLLEMLIEFGFVALILYIYCFKKIINKSKSLPTDYRAVYLTVFMSLPIWIMNPSRILTLYFVWIVVTFLIIPDQNIYMSPFRSD